MGLAGGQPLIDARGRARLAVLIASGDGTGNTTAPPADPGWSHVGGVNGLSGVYVGNGWVLTANHVGVGPMTLGSVTYPVVPGSSVRLEHSAGVPTDLLLFRLISDPGLDPLPIAVTSPPVSTQAILIGRGCDRGAAYTFSGHAGWRWVYTYPQRWGTNAVSQAAADVTVNGGPLRALAFSFDNLGTVPEAIATTGDSGGAVFVGDQLAGIINARWSFGGQASSSSVFGNGTYVADLSYYASQIDAVTSLSACSDGIDDDGDGLVDLADPGCYDANDPFETNALAACDDGFDNDGDGLVDWPNDPGCQTPTSLQEDPPCDDGVDNDGDGAIDWDGGPGRHARSAVRRPWRQSRDPVVGLRPRLRGRLPGPPRARLARLKRRSGRCELARASAHGSSRSTSSSRSHVSRSQYSSVPKCGNVDWKLVSFQRRAIHDEILRMRAARSGSTSAEPARLEGAELAIALEQRFALLAAPRGRDPAPAPTRRAPRVRARSRRSRGRTSPRGPRSRLPRWQSPWMRRNGTSASPSVVDVGERLDGAGVALLARRGQPRAVEQFVERIEQRGVGVEHRALRRAAASRRRCGCARAGARAPSDSSSVSSSGSRPPVRGQTPKWIPAYSPTVPPPGSASGAQTGISASRRSSRKRCSSSMPARLQRAGPVELHHHVRRVFEAQIPDAVLETAQHRAVTGGPQTRRLDRVERGVGAEIGEAGGCHGAGS